jgi:FKBP-type peptidyl-prolyl cis-trans isomerase 2
MKTAIVLILAMFLVFGCVNPPEPPANVANPQPVINTANSTTQVLKPIPSGSSIDIGDTVWVDYTLRVDGKVMDTSNATLANESGIYSAMRAYEPLRFTVEFNKGMIAGFVLGVIGMEVNETQSFQVDPARGYGAYDPRKVFLVDRYYTKNMSENVPRAYLESIGINASIGSAYETSSGTVFIQNVSGDNVTLFYVLMPGKQFTVNGIPQRIANVSNLTATIEFDLDQNQSYSLPDPETGAPVRFTVLNKTNDTITLDSNHPLANKTLDFTVTVLRAERLS